MDNFYIKIHRGEYKPFFQQKNVDFKTEFYKNSKLFPYKSFDSNFLKILRLKQLLHSQALCEGLPLKFDSNENNTEALMTGIQKMGDQYNGSTVKETDWRLAMGLGQASIFDTSLTLHHTYGIPYIPASAVKGILRSWIITEYFSKDGKDLEDAEYSALQNLEFCQIFGAPKECDNKKTKIITEYKNKYEKDIDAYQGDIVFFDAFPTKPPTVSVDIMNPHYPEYYNNEANSDKFQPPADWQNPVPIFFLTIKDTGFQFLFGIKKGKESFNVSFSNSDEKHEGSVIVVLRKLLSEALTFHGIGAKTAVGYGRMQ